VDDLLGARGIHTRLIGDPAWSSRFRVHHRVADRFRVGGVVIDLRPVYHRKEERIRAHVLLCWLALLLTRTIETTCGDTWPSLRRELERVTLGTFASPAGTFRQRTELTTTQRAILAKLGLPEPPHLWQLTPAARGS